MPQLTARDRALRRVVEQIVELGDDGFGLGPSPQHRQGQHPVEDENGSLGTAEPAAAGQLDSRFGERRDLGMSAEIHERDSH